MRDEGMHIIEHVDNVDLFLNKKFVDLLIKAMVTKETKGGWF